MLEFDEQYKYLNKAVECTYLNYSKSKEHSEVMKMNMKMRRHDSITVNQIISLKLFYYCICYIVFL
jgi:hypothetical protein